MKLRWNLAFRFFTDDPGWKLKLATGGLLILVLPPLGWPLALGYRKEAALRLVEGKTPVLPSWSADFRACLVGGVQAVGVILLYYIPFFVVFWTFALDDVETLRAHLPEIAVFFVLLPILVPMCVLLLPPLYWWSYSWIVLSPTEMIAIGILFWGTAFVLPSAFVRVSLSGRMRDALRLRAVVGFIVRNPRLYVEAWALSLVATGLGVSLVPIAPWGIFWSYLVILFAFNDALVVSSEKGVRGRFQNSRLLAPGDVSRVSSR